MIHNPQQAAIYISQTIKETTGQDIDVDIIEGNIEERMNESLSSLLTPDDIKILDEHDDDYFREYCAQKVPNYYTLLDEHIQDFVTEYLTTDENESD